VPAWVTVARFWARLAEAGQTFPRLEAAPWLDRVRALAAEPAIS